MSDMVGSRGERSEERRKEKRSVKSKSDKKRRQSVIVKKADTT